MNAVADRVGDEAIRRFRADYPQLSLAPVVVVIPALDEEASIGGVLAEIPASACGLAVDTVVVDDGSSDRTGEIAREQGAYVARRERNSGQGAAFRVGYRLASEHGARYVVTLDADGQWDPADIPAVLGPVVDGEADFVLGSRVLGEAEGGDVVRRAGVRFFAALVRLLTGVRVTDTSSGLRAMLAEVGVSVRQEQVQYQSSELLLGAIAHGYRVAERPVVMRRRAAGESKKGNNALYGLSYARAILRTWRRERGRAAPGRRGRFAAARDRIAPLLPALRVAGFVAAVAIVVYIGVRAAREVDADEIALWPLPLVLAGAATWWLLLARGWALLVAGRSSRRDISVWARTQALRFIPGGIWAPAARVAVVRGGAVDKLSTVGAENLLALSAALGIGGAALAASGRTPWIALVAVAAVPLLAARLLPADTPLTRARIARATGNYLLAFLAYALAAALVQIAVSGSCDVLAVAGAASVAWAAGLVVVIAPSGVGVREAVYVELLSGTLPFGELAAAAVTMRLAMIVAELAVLVVAGRPPRPADVPSER